MRMNKILFTLFSVSVMVMICVLFSVGVNAEEVVEETAEETADVMTLAQAKNYLIAILSAYGGTILLFGLGMLKSAITNAKMKKTLAAIVEGITAKSNEEALNLVEKATTKMEAKVDELTDKVATKLKIDKAEAQEEVDSATAKCEELLSE